MAENETLNPEMETAEAAAPDVPETPPDTHESGKKPAKKTAKTSGRDAAKLAALEEKLSGSEDKAAELNDKLLRTAAEYDNYRRRSQKEAETAFGNGMAKAVFELLPVLDALGAAANAETTDEEYKKGVLLTLQKCEEIFEKLGIKEIQAAGAPFDPEVHNACMQDEPGSAESGTVTKVIQKGYTHNGRVIRHAMVAVCP